MTESAFIEALARMLVKRVIAPEPGCADARAEVRKVQGKRAARAREDENPMHAQYRVLNRAAGMIVAWAAANSPGAEVPPVDAFVLLSARIQTIVTAVSASVLREARQPATMAWLDRLEQRVVEAALELEVL
jgi:hypothetical protein